MGRVADRIAISKFTIDGVKTNPEVNEGVRNHIYGGNGSWHRTNQESKLLEIVFKSHSLVKTAMKITQGKFMFRPLTL